MIDLEAKTFDARCNHCQKDTVRKMVEKPGGMQPEPKVCPHCDHLLPLPPMSVMIAFVRNKP